MPKSRDRRVRDFVAAHPLPDHTIPFVAVLGWYFGTGAFVPRESSARLEFYSGVAVVSGLVLAAATFVCALTYQSANILMADVRKKYAHELKRNWSSIIFSSFLTAVGPICAMVFDQVNATAAIGLSVYCLALLVARAGRSVFWLNYTLFMQDASESAPRTFSLPPVRSGPAEIASPK